MCIPEDQQIDLLVETFEESAVHWMAIYGSSWTNFEDFKKDFLHCFWYKSQQDQLRQQLSDTVWNVTSGISMLNHFARFASLSRT